MAKGAVIVIEADDWIARLLVNGLTEAGYDVTRTKEALDGFQRVCESKPDCILCDVNLPDFDGHWVAHMVRAERSTVATTPFLFLANAEDESSPLEAFHVGADVVVTKPFRLQDVVTRVGELVGMGKGLREKRDSFIEVSKSTPPAKEAFRGDLAQMSLATILTLLEMDRRSGKLEITVGSESGTIDLAEGLALDGTLRGEPASALEVLREIMKWKDGQFSFVPGVTAPAPATAKSIAGMLFHAVCLDDAKASGRGGRSLAPASQAGPPSSISTALKVPESVARAPEKVPAKVAPAPIAKGPVTAGSSSARSVKPASALVPPPLLSPKIATPVTQSAASLGPRPAAKPLPNPVAKAAQLPRKDSTLPIPAPSRAPAAQTPLRAAPRPSGSGAANPPKKGS